jgi:hypothetical protein
MNVCPDIDVLLEDPNARSLHVEGCEACRGVSALLDLRHERMAGADDACEQAEVSIALLHEGLLTETRRANLVEHLEHCAACNETATRVLALPAFDAPRPTPSAEPSFWRTTTLALGVTTVLASAAALLLFVKSEPPTVEPVPVAAERVQLRDPDDRPGARVFAPAPVVSVDPPPVPLVQPTVAVPPLPAPPPPIKVPFVGGQTTASPKNDDVLNPFAEDTGFLTVLCVPRCDAVSVSGKKLGPSPVLRAVVPVGTVTVSGRKGRSVRATTIVIKKGETSAVRLQLPKMPMDLGF